MTSSLDQPVADGPRPREISGTIVVIAMLMMGLAATTVMFTYWDLHTKPFRPLTEAIGRTFKHSLPKVEGGRHKRGPMTLRIALRVPFVPDDDDAAAQETVKTVCDLIRQHQDLTGYDEVEIHLFHLAPETAAKSRRFTFKPDELQLPH